MIGSSLGCAQTNWNDSGVLSIAKPSGVQSGDLIMALLGNHGDSNVGAGFTQGGGMPAVTDLFLHSWPHPGVGGTLQWKYWTAAGTDPDPYTWSCADILDLGVVLAFHTDGTAITPDLFSAKDNAATTTSPTTAVVGAANRFCVACWYTQSGGVTVDFTGDTSMVTTLEALSAGTLRQVELVQVANSPVGSFTKTATASQAIDSCAYMTTWVGTLVPNPCFPDTFIPRITRYR